MTLVGLAGRLFGFRRWEGGRGVILIYCMYVCRYAAAIDGEVSLDRRCMCVVLRVLWMRGRRRLGSVGVRGRIRGGDEAGMEWNGMECDVEAN